MTDKVQKIREEVQRLMNELIQEKEKGFSSDSDDACILELQNVLTYIDSLQEEPVSEDLNKAAKDYSNNLDNICGSIGEQTRNAFKAGAKWGKEQAEIQIKIQSTALPHGCPKEEPQVKEFAKVQHVKETCKKSGNSLTQEPTSEQKLSNVQRNVKNWKVSASKNLEEEIDNYVKRNGYDGLDSIEEVKYIANHFAEWQKENLWKPADGDDLPEYDREVVVFTQNFPNDAGIMSVAIGHRPNPDGWDGKSLSTGKIEHYTPKTYDKGGWNIPDIVYWLDVELPKEIEL